VTDSLKIGRRIAKLACWAAPLVMAALVAGCGSDGPPRYHLSGNVTYKGQPVPAGSITFLPDSAAGNTGAATSVDINQGKFDTMAVDKGHVGGAHIVKITGLDGVASDEFPKGVMLFPDYETKADLPKEDSTKDFEVPADLVMPKAGPVKPGA